MLTPTPRAASWTERLVGQTLGTKYRVVRLIGEGSSGAVFEGVQVFLRRAVAVKVLRPELAQAPEVVRRFQQEAQAIVRVRHANVVDVLDFDRLRDGTPYFVMEFLAGTTLDREIQTGGALPFDRLVRIGAQVAAALEAAHEARIVHRDLKPANVVLLPADHVKVVDFGIARVFDEMGERLTRAGEMLGTPYYMSPEQIEDTLAADERSDVYSLGAVLYEMATGTPPFRGDEHVAVLRQHLLDPVEPPSARRPDLDLPPWLDSLVLQMMAKNKNERPGSMGIVRADLEAAAT